MNDDDLKKAMGHKDLSDKQKILILNASEAGVELECMCEEAVNASTTDQRWAAIARTHFQEGLMALKRAIANPDTF